MLSIRQPETLARALQFCVVGAGPAGFYSAGALLRELPNCRVHILERLPVPFGLVRYGVAPDHPEVKAVQSKFTAITENPRVRFWGNVSVGSDLSVEELREHCDGIILAQGASDDRKLLIPGEDDLDGVHSARDFVGWYNGHPDCADSHFDLKNATSVAVLGNGNVAMDVSRILLKSPEELRKTDISERAMETLSQSQVKHVHIIGRRGVAQAAWTGKELRELLTLPDVRNVIHPSELALEQEDTAELQASRVKRRCTELILKQFREQSSPEHCRMTSAVSIRFLLSPTAFVGIGEGERGQQGSELTGIRLQRMQLSGPAGDRKVMPLRPAVEETINCQLVFRSVGYRGRRMAGVPFNDKLGVIPNKNGFVSRGVYVAGWIKRGPSGVIGSNRWDAEETVLTMIGDLASETSDHPREQLNEYLKARFGQQAVDTNGYKAILAEEQRRGAVLGKTSSKLTDWDRMVAFAKDAGSRQGGTGDANVGFRC